MPAPKTTVIGSYPVFASEAEVEHYLRRQKKEEGSSVFSPFLKTTERAFRDQVSAGVEVPSTGQTPFDFLNLYLDPAKVEGVESIGSGRKVVSDLKRREPLRLDEVKHLYELIDDVSVPGSGGKLLKAKEPITDPYTLATGVQNATNKDTRELTFEILREIVIPEAKSIAPYVGYFQFDAPRYSSVSARPDYLPKIYEELRAELDKPIILHVCGDTSGIFEELTGFDVDVLSLDFTLTPRLTEVASRKNYDQTLGVGLTKTEPRVESVDEVRGLIAEVCKGVGEDRVSFLHPACGQRNLPLSAAYEKDVNITLARDEYFYGSSPTKVEVATHSERLRPSSYDPRGKFRILVDRGAGRIVLSLVDYQNVPKRRISGDYADKIIRKILADGLLEGDKLGMLHLGYVALELGKAETALHNGLDYRQDQPLLTPRG